MPSRLTKYIIKRLLFLIPIFLAASAIIFVVMNLAGNPVMLMVATRPGVTAQQIKLLETYYQIDKPIWYQYFLWLSKFVQGDLGQSFINGESVATMIGAYAWETLKLQLVCVFLAVGISIPIGVKMAQKQYSKLDYFVTGVSLFGYSMPVQWLGILFILCFALYLHLFPSFGAHSIDPSFYPLGSSVLDELWHMVLPTIVLTYSYLAMFVRLVRSGMLEELRQDYVLAARASGLSPRTVVYKHALRNALIPVVTYAGLYLALSIAGAPITETVFTWPGLGYLFVQSILHLDYPVIMGVSAILAIIVVLVNLATDLVYVAVDPRITLE
jgi:ABC-type dipeptide/oligopeptide/nickel transport system permease component